MSVGVPIKLLHEAVGHVISIETTTYDVYRGKLVETEDSMNCTLQDVIVKFRDGTSTEMRDVFIRGNKIQYLILPDMFKNAPMFTRPRAARGKSGILGAQAARRQGRGADGPSNAGPSYCSRGQGQGRGHGRGHGHSRGGRCHRH